MRELSCLCGHCKRFKYNDDDPLCGLCINKYIKRNKKAVDDTFCNDYEFSPRNYFFYHYFFEWDLNTVYFTTDFEDVLGITRQLSRYYLLNVLTYGESKVFRVMISNKGYYIKKDTIHYDNMKKFARENLCKVSP